MLEVKDRLDGRYLILARIGQGGMSYVYRALDERLMREVAVKVLKEELLSDEESARRFSQEARAAAGLSHPNIVATYDIVDNGEYHYIVMELVEGITLKKYIARKGVLSDKEAIGIALQAASGLSEAHKAGIVHRDVKPQNIIISRDGKIKVSDFGIAVLSEDDDTDGELIVGSAHYISPEQVESGIADQRSDIYSLGISMYEMLTGRVPYSGENAVDIALMHVEDALVPPDVYNPAIFPALNDIILKAAAKDPDERYASCDELIADLKRAVSEPNGHFVKRFDVSGESEDKETTIPEEESESGITAALNLTTQAEEGDAPGEATEEITEPRFSKREKLLAGIVLGAFVLFLIVFSVVMMRKSHARRTAAESTEVFVAADAETEESEMNYTISIEGEDLVPDVTGMSINLARARLGEFGLSMDSSSEEYSDIYVKGAVIRQNPSGGELFSIGTTVYVTVSGGSVLDDISDDTVETASEKLMNSGYRVDETIDEEFNDIIAEGRVICPILIDSDGARVYRESDIEGDADTSNIPLISPDSYTKYTARLVVSRGAISDYVLMPDLSGMDAADAKTALEGLGLITGSVTAVRSADIGYGLVTAQSIAPGEYVRLGTGVSLNVNVGADSDIPEGEDVSGLTSGMPVQSSEGPELSDDYYYGSINTTCVISGGNIIGSVNSAVNVSVRLRQNVGGADEYTHIFGPIPVSLGDAIPVSFRNMRGAFGVTEGYVEVYNPDTAEIYSTYRVEFGPLS